MPAMGDACLVLRGFGSLRIAWRSIFLVLYHAPVIQIRFARNLHSVAA